MGWRRDLEGGSNGKEVGDDELNAIRDAVHRCVLPGKRDLVGVDVNGNHCNKASLCGSEEKKREGHEGKEVICQTIPRSHLKAN